MTAYLLEELVFQAPSGEEVVLQTGTVVIVNPGDKTMVSLSQIGLEYEVKVLPETYRAYRDMN